MTEQELKDYIATQLTAPVNQVQKVINSFNQTIDFITSAVSDIIPNWTNALTFQLDGSDDGRYCIYPDTNGKKRIFETLVDDNIGNAPPTNPLVTADAFWQEVSSSGASSINEWAPGLYMDGLIIVFWNHSVDGPGLYLLTEPVRPFASADIEAEITAGKWQIMTGVSGGAPGTWVTCAPYDASTNLYPDVGTAVGTGVAGAIKKGNAFPLSVGGILAGDFWPAGTIVLALIDAPGQTNANWRRL